MKFSLTTLVLAVLAASASAETNKDKCWKINQNVVKAVEAFCANTKLTIPSTYAMNGAHVGQGGSRDTTIGISGNCSPRQWVPQKYCRSQFYHMCVTAAKSTHGDNGANYGRNRCQVWDISVGGRKTTPAGALS